MKHEKVAVLDFGGQYAHLIANRVRRLNVFSEILEPETSLEELKKYKGIILSGGPMSVYGDDSPTVDPGIFDLGVPVLGICYGHQLMQHLLGGKVSAGGTKEYGMAELKMKKKAGIFEGLSDSSRAWMSHGDTVQEIAEGFEEIGETDDLPNSAVANLDKNFFGVQFHPEVTHSEEGMPMIDNFLKLCKVSRDWSIEQFIQEEVASIQQKVGDKKVFLLVSGGVDSTVCFALLEKALGEGRVHGFLVDHGLMRLDEADMVKSALDAAGFTNLNVIEAQDKFMNALAGKVEPEEKRKIIGELFWNVKEDIAEERGLNPEEWIVAQGTIYPDTIETGGTKHAETIKTHHNRVDLMVELIEQGKVIEPIAQLYKDEVRDLGEKLGLPHELVWRHPFPGPGLGVRILCSDEEATVDLDFEADYNVLPVKSVGVQGDGRTYKHPGLVRKMDEKFATDLVNKNEAINRAVYLLKAQEESATVHLHKADTNVDRVAILQKADDKVTKLLHEMGVYSQVWQFPVVLAPMSFGSVGTESVILRPVESIDAMSASAARLSDEFFEKVATAILEDENISAVLLDLTHKPPGTIEWE